MPQSRARRMFLMWKAEKRRHDYRNGESHSPLMRVAQRFRTPIREVRDVIDGQKNV